MSLGTPRPWSSLEGNLATSRLWHMTEKIQWWLSIHYIHAWFLWMAGPNEGWLLQRCQPCPVCLTLVRREELYKIHAGLVIVIAGYSWKKLTHNHKPLWNLLVSILSDMFFCVNILKLPRYSTRFYVVILHCSQCHNAVYDNDEYIFIHETSTPSTRKQGKPHRGRRGRRDVCTCSVAADVISALVP